MRSLRTAAAPGAEQGVTTLELFFDLVFVYTITQMTTVVRASPGSHGYLKAAGFLVVTWWMYNGYGWLANNVAPTEWSTRWPMLVAMFGFLVMAVATPDAYASGAWPFAIAYLVVVLVHGAQFGRSALGGSARAILRVLPLNLAMVAGLVLAAFLAPHRHAWIGWAVAVAFIVVAAVRVRGTGFTLRAEHFAERHQLLIMIALGETVVATGAAAQGRLREAAVLSALLMAMVLLAALWWTYFGGDDARAARALAGAPEARRSELAFWGYSLGHLVHVAGLILVAAGLHDVIANPTLDLEARVASTLGLGTAVFLCAEALVRRLFGIGAVVPLLVASIACCVVAVIGSHLVALVEIELLAGILVAALVSEPTVSA